MRKQIGIILFAMILLSSFVSAGTLEELQALLVGYYKGETAASFVDSSGYLNHGSCFNGVALVSDCKVGNCLNFSSPSQQFCNVSNTDQLQPDNSRGMTIAYWLKPNQISTANTGIVTKTGNVDTQGWAMLGAGSGVQGLFGYYYDTGLGAWRGLSNEYDFVKDSWVFVILCLKDGNQTLIINNTQKESKATAAITIATTNPLNVGKPTNWASPEYLNGTMDELMIFNESICNNSDYRAYLYNGGAGADLLNPAPRITSAQIKNVGNTTPLISENNLFGYCRAIYTNGANNLNASYEAIVYRNNISILNMSDVNVTRKDNDFWAAGTYATDTGLDSTEILLTALGEQLFIYEYWNVPASVQNIILKAEMKKGTGASVKVYFYNDSLGDYQFVTDAESTKSNLTIPLNRTGFDTQLKILYNITQATSGIFGSSGFWGSELQYDYLRPTNTDLNVINISNTNTSAGDSFKLSCHAVDGNLTGDWVNSSEAIISTFSIDDCGIYTKVAVNYTFKNTSEIPVNVSLQATFEASVDNFTNAVNFSFSKTSITNFSICIYPDWATPLANIQMQYVDASNTYNYNANSYLLDNVTDQVTLYTQSGTTQVLLSVYDLNSEPIENVYIKVLRQNIGNGSFTTTEVLRTDSSGKAIANLVLYSVYYRFILEIDGEVVLTEDSALITTTTKNFYVDFGTSTWFDDAEVTQNVLTSLYYNNLTNNFVYNWNDVTNQIHQACLRVTADNSSGRTLLTDNCATSMAGTLYYNQVPVNDTLYIAQGYLKFDNVVITNQLELIIKAAQKFFSDGDSKMGIFITFLVCGSLFFIGIWNPLIALGLMFIGILVMVKLGMWVIGISAAVGIGALIIINMMVGRQG